LNILKNYSIT